MLRKTWILGSLTAVLLAACGGGAENQNTGGTGMESGAGTMTDTTTGAATMDTALTGDTATTR